MVRDFDRKALSVPKSEDCIEPPVTLSKRISALVLLPQPDGSAKVGNVVELEPGTDIAVCGLGYDPRTVKVRVDGGLYFVFRQDLG